MKKHKETEVDLQTEDILPASSAVQDASEEGTVLLEVSDPEKESVNADAEASGQKKKRSLRARVLVLCCVLVAVAAVVLAIVFSLPKPVRANRRLYAALTSFDSGKTVFYSGEDTLATAGGTMKKRLVSFGGDWDATLTDTGELFLLHENEATLISSEAQDVLLATEGGTLLYLDVSGDVYLSRIAAEEEARIICHTEDQSLQNFALSPNGESVFYFLAEEGSANLYTDGVTRLKSIEVTEEMIPLGVSDDAMHLYYLDLENTALFYASKDGALQKLSASFSADAPVRFNRTMSQVLFSESNSYTYYSENGGTKRKLFSGIASPVYRYGECSVGEGVCRIESLSAFAGNLYLVRLDDVQSLRSLNADFTLEKYASDVVDARFSADGKTLYLIRRPDERYRIYQVDLTGEKRQEILVASGVVSYAVGTQGSEVYYITRGNKLYLRSRDNSTLLAENAETIYVSPTGRVFWSVPTSENGMLLSVFKDSNACRITAGFGSLQFTENDIYVSVLESEGETWYYLRNEKLVPLS